jgi:acylphosphatase
MRTHGLLHRTTIAIAALTSSILVAIAPALTKSKLNGANVTAISGIVSGKVQQVGFRAMIQKQAIANNLAGAAENNDDDKTVRFSLQGDRSRVNRAVAAIEDGTKKSSDVKVSLSPATLDPNLKTFTVVGWNSVSRKITNRYDLVFTLREDNTTIKKKAAKQVWLGICTKAVAKTEDAGKCDKDDD